LESFSIEKIFTTCDVTKFVLDEGILAVSVFLYVTTANMAEKVFVKHTFLKISISS
jgi:hypothetical protein